MVEERKNGAMLNALRGFGASSGRSERERYPAQGFAN